MYASGNGMGSDEAESVKKDGGSRDESEEGGWYDRSDHPLLNHVVLSIVFEHMKLRDLKACRGVCKKWNMSTIPVTRSKWIVRIDGSRTGEDYYLGKKTLGIGQFIELFSKNQLGIPFGRFRLGSFCVTDGDGQEFLKLCGHLAKYIDFNNDDPFDVEDVSELLKSTPNLVKFHIPRRLRSRSGNIVKLFPDDGPKPKLSFMENLKSIFDYPEERRKCCPTFVEELLTAGENVSHLTLRDSGMDNDKTTQSTSLEVLTAIEKLGRESSIQTLKFGNMDHEHLQMLGRMRAKGMKLKRLNSRGSFKEPFHIKMARLFKDTLEYYSPVLCSSFIGFPTMPYLKSLDLCTMNKFNSECINLCKIFPALEELNVHHCDSVIYDEFFSESDPCQKMKTFRLVQACMRLKPFTRIQTIFPNLTELRVRISLNGDEILRSIWSGMTKLKILELWGNIQTTDNNNESLDSIFTGLSIHTLQEMENLVKNLDNITNKKLKRESFEAMINGTSPELPSIRNLTNLSRLRLCMTGEGNDEQGTRTYLTEMTAYLSLYSMKQIRHLTVEECQFTKTCCEALVTDMELQSWKFTGSRKELIIPEMKAD